MLLLMAAEQVRRMVRGPDQTGRVIGLVADAAKPATSDSPLAVVTDYVPAGTRYQLLRALRAMAGGEAMVVEHRIPSLPEHFDNNNNGKRSEWLRRLRNSDSWKDQDDIDPVLVPGTAYPCVIGRILIRAGWCAPCEQPHWVPNLRFFYLTEVGRESLRNAQAWWSGLTTLERMRVMLLE